MKLHPSKKIFVSYAAAAALFLPQTLWAASGGHNAPLNILKDVVFPFVNFSILFFVLFFLLRRPIKDFLLARSKNLASSIEAQAHEKQEAEAKTLNYERRLKNIEKEIEDLAGALKKEGELVRGKIVQEAEASSERIRELTERIGKQELRKAKERLKEEAVELASEFAEKLVKEGLKPQDKERLTEDAFQKLARLA